MHSRALDDIGTYRTVRFRAGQTDPVQADVDLLVAGMPAIDAAACADGQPGGLDEMLAATMSQLRAGGLFDGAPGETLVLDQLAGPYHACSVLVVGLGDPAGAGPAEFGRLAAIATRAAKPLRHRSVRGMLHLPTQDASLVEAIAAEIMAGTLRTMDDRSSVIRCLSQDCTIDLRTPHARRGACAMRRVLEQWPG